MHRLNYILLSALFLLLLGCKDEDTQTVQPAQNAPEANMMAAQSGRSGVVVETMNAGGYTYLQVDTGEEKIWAAAPQMALAVGDEVHMPEGMPMRNFHSESLDRDFEVLYFVDAVNVGGAPMGGGMGAHGMQQMPPGHPNVSADASAAGESMDFSDIDKARGGYTVGEVYAQRAGLSGKEVVVRGKVVKFNRQIMGTNWLHIQDGTGSEGANDLTISTDATAEVGQTVLVRGVLAVDKDFGAGYRYAAIVEDAEVTVE